MFSFALLIEAAAAAPFPGIDAFSSGEEGYSCFRLPALLRLPSADGLSLGLYAEGRLKSCSDYAPMDLVYKVSRDNGASWSNLSILCTDGCTTHWINGTRVHDAAYANTTNQPSPVAVLAQGATPGYVVMLSKRHGRLHTARSLDPLGTAWEPLNDTGLEITPGPTPGVVLPSGRLAVAAYGQVLLSDDGGRGWRGSASYGPNGSMPYGGEGEVAITPNGSLLVNYRHKNPYKRTLAYSNDEGESWGPEFEPMPELGGSVEGSMIRIADSDLMLTASPPL